MLGQQGKQTNFQLVYKVLGELYAQVKAQHKGGADDAIKTAIQSLKRSYEKLEDPNNKAIDYSDPTVRFAYVFKYVASHADYVFQMLNTFDDELGDILASHEKLVVSCLGGGPGSELVGLLQYLIAHAESDNEVVTCYLLDREQAWADAWTEIGQELDSDINLYVNFQQLDVADSATWLKQRKFLSADLFISCYFASEIVRFKDQAAGMWKELGKSAKEGSRVLFLDNDHSTFEGYIAEIMKAAGFHNIALEKTVLTPSYNEQKSDLKEFLEKFGQQPKLKSKLIAAVYEKK